MLEKNTCKGENGVQAVGYPLFSVAQSVKLIFSSCYPLTVDSNIIKIVKAILFVKI